MSIRGNTVTPVMRALPQSGGTMAGDIEMAGHMVTGLVDPKDNSDASNKSYTDRLFGNVKETAENALPKAGGQMTGNIDMSGNKVTGIASPLDDTDAVNKGYVDAMHMTADAVIGSEWDGAAAPYSQTVVVPGILDSDTPHVAPVLDSDLATAITQMSAWAMISQCLAQKDSLVFTCFADKPPIAIPIQIEVNR